MKCPVCHSAMVEKDFDGVMVDVCSECKGLWFDWFELSRLKEKNEVMSAALDEALKAPRSNDENRDPIKCPKCSIPMHAHKYKSSKLVNVDECYKCARFFLDSGELRVIRDTLMTEEEEQEHAEQVSGQVPAFAEARRHFEKDKARTEAIRRLTRFVRISYYAERQ